MTEISKLNEKIAELEFKNLWYEEKIKELEGKRTYYRKDREDKINKFEKMYILSLTDDFYEEKQKLKLKEMSIHEKYEYFAKDYENLCDLRHSLMESSFNSFYEDYIGNTLTYEDDLSEKITEFCDYIENGDYVENIRDGYIEHISQNISEYYDKKNDVGELFNKVIDYAIEEEDVVSYCRYEDICEEKDNYETAIEEVLEHMEKLLEEDFKEMGRTGYLSIDSKLEINYKRVVKNLVKTTLERNEFKIKYETLKNNYEGEESCLNMIEEIMDKTKDINEKDIDRVKEINRLKEKCNRFLVLYNGVVNNYVLDKHNKGYDYIFNVSFNRKKIENYINDLFKVNFKVSYNSLSYVSLNFQHRLNKYLNEENVLSKYLKELISNISFPIIQKDKQIRELELPLEHKEKLFGIDRISEGNYILNENTTEKEKEYIEKEVLDRHFIPFNNMEKFYTKNKEELEDINNY